MLKSNASRHAAAHPSQTNGRLLHYSQLLDSIQARGGNEYEKTYRKLVVNNNPRRTESDRIARRG